jgi:ethanolamine utilization protein EutN
MLIGTVVGNVWSTKKDPTLAGLRFLVVRPYKTDGNEGGETIIAVDPLGAGIGERVLVVFGRAARHAIGKGHDIGFQTAVAAIVDKMELANGTIVGSTADDDTHPGWDKTRGSGSQTYGTRGSGDAPTARPTRAERTGKRP